MAKLFNRAKMTTATTGVGTVVLGSAANGFQTFADAGVSDGDVVQYVIEEGPQFEIGTGTYSASGVSLTRNPTESSDAGNGAITLVGGASVSITAIADDFGRLQSGGDTKVEATSTGATVTGDIAVTGTVDGRDVAADGAKLDGIEAGATGDQTASEILTEIKTVDGSGSGLDADLLDGLQASQFLRSDASDSTSGDLTVNGHIYGRSVNGQYSNLYRMGGVYFTWDSDSYGSNTNHSIRSTNGDTYGDSITINSYGNVRVNIDSNSNGSNTFSIGSGTTGTGNTRLTLDEAGKLTVTAEVETPLVDTNSVQIGSTVTLQESTDRADLLQITGSTSTWAGIQIRNSSNEGRWSFMTDGETGGIYNDEDNQWHMQFSENSETRIYHAGTEKLNTTSSGIYVHGNVDVGGSNLVVDNNKGIINSGSWTRNKTPYGYIEFGPANTSWAHIYTDRANFYFNKQLYVNGAIVSNAGLGFGSVGTYAFAGRYSTTKFYAGSTYAGSVLKAAGAAVTVNTLSDGANSNGYPTGGGGALSGTWRCMGRSAAGSGSDTRVTLFLRIS